MSESKAVWEQRWHPFRGEWVLFTSHRGGRPWVGDIVSVVESLPPAYDSQCALCPGNRRMAEQNPRYEGVYVFANDLPCFDGAASASAGDDLYRTRPAAGAAEVVCYHPNHAKTFADLQEEEAVRVIEVWTGRSKVLGCRPEVKSVLIFENKGSLVGTSNPHPHCQIYAGNLVYGHIAQEAASARAYYEKNKGFLGQEVLRREASGPRVVCENAAFLACVPWFARYAYEIYILPKRQVASLAGLAPAERRALAALMREVAIRYDNLWRRPMPYVMAVHQAPTDGQDDHCFPFHLEYHPPLRKPDTMKYLAGPEVGGGSMTNESNPDEKAAELRAAGPILYREPL